MSDDEIIAAWDDSALRAIMIGGAEEAIKSFARVIAEAERKACAQICHERYMELKHGTSQGDPLDDYENGLQSAIAKELRDKIVCRK